ncbi:MerR family transcriptional regulator [Tessaracoccus sp. G1721]
MSAPALQQQYTIKEAAALTGLPASTLRYYESIGVISPVARGMSSGHRVYDETDLDQLMGVACLAATGMSVADMRAYVANNRLGPDAAADQIALLTGQQRRLEVEAELLAVRQRYVALKIDYWRAVEDGDATRADAISAEARALADELKRSSKP